MSSLTNDRVVRVDVKAGQRFVGVCVVSLQAATVVVVVVAVAERSGRGQCLRVERQAVPQQQYREQWAQYQLAVVPA